MFHSRVLNNKTNRRHKRRLRAIYNNKKFNSEDLLVSVHRKNIHALAIGTYKIVTDFSPKIPKEIF